MGQAGNAHLAGVGHLSRSTARPYRRDRIAFRSPTTPPPPSHSLVVLDVSVSARSVLRQHPAREQPKLSGTGTSRPCGGICERHQPAKWRSQRGQQWKRRQRRKRSLEPAMAAAAAGAGQRGCAVGVLAAPAAAGEKRDARPQAGGHGGAAILDLGVSSGAIRQRDHLAQCHGSLNKYPLRGCDVSTGLAPSA